MAKHSSGPAPWALGQKVLAAFVALLVVVGAFSAVKLLRDGRSDDGPGSAASGDGDNSASTGDGAGSGDEGTATDAAQASCTPVTVWVAAALVPATEAAVEAATDDCFSYVVVPREAALAQSALRGGETPDVWLADSTAWPQLLADDGVELTVGDTIASSPVMLAGAPQVIEAIRSLGVGPETDWPSLMATYQEVAATGEAPVALRVGDPRVDPATMSLLSTAGAEAGWSDAGSAARAMLVVLAQTAIQGDPVAAVGSDPKTVVPATEQQLAAAAEDGVQLTGLPLAGGLGVVHMPFVRVGDTGSAQAVDALEEALTSEAAVEALTGSGLRAGKDGPAPGVAGVPEGLTGDAPDAAPEQVVLTAKMWTVIAPQSRILTLIDISGSMEVEVGDTTRIDLTRAAAQTALSVIPEQTAIGAWYFATALDGKKDYTEVVPLRPLNEEVRSGVTQKDLLMSVTDDLGLDTLTGDTGLHDSLWAAYQSMQAQYTPESISSVLLLTDGMNDDTTGGLSEKEVIAKLTAAREKGDRPVTVVLIGMGPEVDADALQRLATAAGGESLVLRDPRELPQVFVDVVARRAT